jgi:hypothetical protein
VNGIIKVTGHMFLRFFYPDDWVYEEGYGKPEHHALKQVMLSVSA